MPERTTMRDVARLAGVSVQTVSRVLNESGPVSDSTKKQVLEAAAMLKYEINLAARSLASKSSDTTGLVVTGEIRHGVARLFSALEKELTMTHRRIVVATSPTDQPDALRQAMSHVHGTNPAGMVVLARTSEVLPLITAKAQVPCVVIIAGGQEGCRLSTISTDQYGGAVAATQHVIDQGCRSIVYFTGDLLWQDAQVRLQGFRDCCEANGIEPEWFIGHSWSLADGHAMGQRLLRSGLPDAVIGGNDDIAIGAMHAFYRAGVSIPEDVCVVGFDDIPQAKYQNPSLTTIRQDFTQLGHAALAELDRVIAGQPPRYTQIPTSLVVRGSTRRGHTES